MARLSSKVAIVTGGARGQGEAEARLFAAEGARVVVADVLDDEGQAVATDIGDAARYVHLDVTQESEWDAAIAFAGQEFGRLDVLVNNAGIVRGGPIEELSLQDYMAVISVNQVGAWLGMKKAIPALRAASGGSIVNISSIDGLSGVTNGSAYVSSKFALTGMTRSVASEVGPHGIRVNSVHPGFVSTDFGTTQVFLASDKFADDTRGRIPLRRAADADEIAKLVLFLASDDSSFCTGAQFVADGGQIACFM